ncbi:MAG: prolyl oligopeptidase family serine peptidase [Planctomycetia bacterium]|nr:prolyl oligopeptidase family serine peptidase [Planctomycetia bacterium]
MHAACPVNRREMLQLLGLQFAGLALADTVRAQPPAGRTPLNRFPRMVQDHFVARVRAIEAAGNEARAKLKSKEDAEAYVRMVQQKIRDSFGPFPKKTPLMPRVTGTVERDEYTIEKVIFESRPEFLVTANLYIPKGKKLPAPGVVGSCGHSLNGKAAEAYQSFAQGLARQGYVTLIFDPIGQGERLQYLHLPKGIRPSPSVGEHLHAGNQQFLVGEFFGSWRAWDGIRALDYLLTRKEVDPNHVGITGNSGGGTMTTWLCGVEQRWTMGAPSCFVTTLRRNLENELPADTEQCPPRLLSLGLDHADFLAALAPKPVVILAQERDYFDARGAEEAYGRLKRLYGLLGSPDNVRLFIGPQPHGYSQENREAMYQWFNRATKISQATAEPKLIIEKDDTLYCAPQGQVAELKSRTVFSFTLERAKQLAKQRKALDGDALKQALVKELRLPERTGVADYRILRNSGGRKYPKPQSTTYAVETEPGVFALVYRLSDTAHISRPPKEPARAVLYVAHHSSDAELRSEPLLAEIIKDEAKADCFTCDVRGIGESRPDTCGGTQQFLTPYGNDYFYAAHALMLDYPYLGQKTFDVLRVLDWLKSIGRTEVHLVARGWGALPATFAAVLSDQVTQVTLKNALTSYQEIAESEHYHWPLSALLPGVLERFDLPDCYRALQAKKLRQVEPWGPLAGEKA